MRKTLGKKNKTDLEHSGTFKTLGNGFLTEMLSQTSGTPEDHLMNTCRTPE